MTAGKSFLFCLLIGAVLTDCETSNPVVSSDPIGRKEESREIGLIMEDKNPEARELRSLSQKAYLQAKNALSRGERAAARYYLKKALTGPLNRSRKVDSLSLLGDLSYLERDYEDAFRYYVESINTRGLKSEYQALSRLWLRLAEITFYYRKDSELARRYFHLVKPSELAEQEKELFPRLKKRLTWQELPPSLLGLSDGNISALEPDGDDLWIGTWNGGIARYSLAGGEAVIFREGRESLEANAVRCIEITKKRVWIGTYQGLYTYSKLNSKWQEIEHFGGANPDRVEAVKEIDGTIYVGTLGRGLWRLKNGEWEKINARGLPGKFINCLERAGNFLLIGTVRSGMVLYNIDSGSLRSFSEINPQFEAGNITMILADPADRNTVWIGTYGMGLYRWERDSNRTLHYTKETGSLSDNWVLCGVRAESGLYFGTFGGGVSHLANKSERWRTLGLREGLSSLDISAVGYSPPFIFFGTLGAGISVYHEEQGQL